MNSDYDLFVKLCKSQNLKDDYGNFLKELSHNKAMKKLDDLQKRMKKKKSFDILIKLMNHEDERVRLNAAAFSINVGVQLELSRIVLEQIMLNSSDLTLRFSAEQLLKSNENIKKTN